MSKRRKKTDALVLTPWAEVLARIKGYTPPPVRPRGPVSFHPTATEDGLPFPMRRGQPYFGPSNRTLKRRTQRHRPGGQT